MESHVFDWKWKGARKLLNKRFLIFDQSIVFHKWIEIWQKLKRSNQILIVIKKGQSDPLYLKQTKRNPKILGTKKTTLRIEWKWDPPKMRTDWTQNKKVQSDPIALNWERALNKHWTNSDLKVPLFWLAIVPGAALKGEQIWYKQQKGPIRSNQVKKSPFI